MKKLFLILLFCSLCYGESHYYLAPWGNDSGGDGSKANPWFTMTKADDSIGTDRPVYVHLATGTYHYSTLQTINTRTGTSESNRIYYSGDIYGQFIGGFGGPDSVILDYDSALVDAIYVRAGVQYITIENIFIVDTYGYGVGKGDFALIEGVDYINVINCGTDDQGTFFYTDEGPASTYNYFINCWITNGAQFIAYSRYTYFINCVVSDSLGSGVTLDGNASNCKVLNCIISSPANYGLYYANITSQESNYNFVGTGGTDFGYWNGSDLDFASWKTTSGQDDKSVNNNDPLFDDVTHHKLKIGYTSAARNIGAGRANTSIPAIAGLDYYGRPRGQGSSDCGLHNITQGGIE